MLLAHYPVETAVSLYPNLTDDIFRLSMFANQMYWRYYALSRFVEHPTARACSLSGNVAGEIVASGKTFIAHPKHVLSRKANRNGDICALRIFGTEIVSITIV